MDPFSVTISIDFPEESTTFFTSRSGSCCSSSLATYSLTHSSKNFNSSTVLGVIAPSEGSTIIESQLSTTADFSIIFLLADVK